MLKEREKHAENLLYAVNESNDLREQAEKLVNELSEQKHAFDQHSIIATTDIKGTITYVNDKFCEISGYTKEELIGANHRLLNSDNQPKDYWRNMFLTVSKGKVWNDEVRNKAKDGHLYWVDTTIVPLKGKGNKIITYIAIRTDITERKHADIELVNAIKTAEDAFKAKGEFFASMSHEIRTPMNGVIGMLGLLLDTHLNDEQKHRARLAQTSAESLLVLINDILDFSKVEAGKLELESLDFNLRDMLGDFAQSMGLQAQKKNLELILDVKNIEVSMVVGDPGRLR